MTDDDARLDSGIEEGVRREGVRWREARAGCPPPDLVMAHASEALPDEVRERLSEHLRGCDACRRLAADADAVELEVPPGVEARVLARVQAPRRFPPGTLWVLAASVLLVCGLAAMRRLHPGGAVRTTAGRTLETPQMPAAVPAAAAPVRQAARWQISAATVRVPLSSLAVSRGADAEAARGRRLVAALAPYEKADYPAAISALEAFVKEFPDAADAVLYLGVSYLMADRPEAALAPLAQAADLRSGRGRREVDWYLAAAEQRTGRTAEAAARLEGLCRAPGAYQQSACAAAATLR